MNHLRSGLLCSLVALVACTQKPSPESIKPRVVFSVENSVRQVNDNPHVLVNEPISFLVTITDEKGAPLTNYKWQWSRTLDASIVETTTRVSAGVERITLTSPSPVNGFVSGQLLLCDGTTCNVVVNNAHIDSYRYTVWGGLAKDLVVDTVPVKLSVGESRTLLAIPVTDTPQHFVSHEAVTLQSEDPATVKVLSDGRVEGVSVGETTVTFAAGAARRKLKVSVNTVPMGPPPEGTTLLASGLVSSWINGFRDHLAVDSRGYPVLPVRISSPDVGSPEMLLARWTGTGFGFDRIEPGTDFANNHEGNIHVDATNRVWLSYYSQTLPIVLDADLTQPVLTWRRRPLKVELEKPNEAGLTNPQGYVVSNPTDRMRFMARGAQGAYLTYTVTAELSANEQYQSIADEGLASGILKGRCLRAVLVAELTDTSFTFREQEHAFFPGTPQQCGELKIDSRFEPQLLKATETLPSLGGPDAGMAFTPSTAFMNLPSTIGPLQQSLWPRPTAGTYIFEVQSKICTTLGTPVFQCFEPLGARFYDSARYALGLSDTQWSVDLDAPSPAILGTRDTFYFLTAWEREGQRLLSVRIPPLPAFNGTEATGARMTHERFPAPVEQPLHVRADGQRFILTEALPAVGTTGGLLTSAGANQPFTVTLARDPVAFDPVAPLLSNSTRLRTVRRANATQIALIDSTDDGATWSDRTQIDSSLVFRAGLMKADGSTLFALSAATGIGHQVLAVHTAPDGTVTLDPIVPFTPPATWSDNSNSIGLIDDGAGHALYVGTITSPGGSTATQKLVIDRLEFSGARIDTTFIDAPGDVRPHTVVRDASGDLLMLRWASEAPGNPLRFVRVNMTTSIVTSTDLMLTDWHRPSLLRLPSGQLVIGATWRISGGKDRAVTLTSTDGINWSAPHMLRPNGGGGQLVYSMTVDADGTLLALLGDSGSILNAREWENAASLGPTARTSAPLIPLVQRVSGP